ncbi:DNA polymerase delta, subunit 4-domain-containing protein [Biscogniauxia marginata]|nr:DNA polymerase delta, subunit 4-domain-containing protein [Biscogniauxia marginata]
MPIPRRTTRSSAGGAKQSTLSFNHRVTKSSVPKSAKDLTTSPTKKPSPLAKHVSAQDEEEEEPTAITTTTADADVDIDVEALQDDDDDDEPEPVPQKSEAELRAEKVTGRQIDQYWRQLERDRLTRRVHQEDLSLAEKVLRYWDVSSQYGPCVGISRMKRWHRADRLGLNPPVEVLAVLMKESEGALDLENAHMDEILNSTAVGAF